MFPKHVAHVPCHVIQASPPTLFTLQVDTSTWDSQSLVWPVTDEVAWNGKTQSNRNLSFGEF